jgi:hypothetical protein
MSLPPITLETLSLAWEGDESMATKSKSKRKLPKLTKIAAWYYLGAMVDGEGCVKFFRNARGQYDRGVLVCNTDLDIINAVEVCMSILDIPFKTTRISTGQHKPIFNVIVIGGKRSFEYLYANLPLASEEKADKLEAIVNSYTRDMYCPDDDELRRLYSDPFLRVREIADRFNVSEPTVRKWARQA